MTAPAPMAPAIARSPSVSGPAVGHAAPDHPAPQRGAETHRTYDGFSESCSEVVYPRAPAEVAEALRRAAETGRRVVVRGAGLSLDRHSASDELTICTARLDRIAVEPDGETVTAQSGATWGAVLDATAPHGLVPYAMPTAPHITVGGSLATNALSRMSCSQGQEGASVERFEVALMDGTLRRCSRAENRELFFGVIAGLGQLGVITSVTYRLLRRGPAEGGALQVYTHLVKERGTADIERKLSPDPDRPEISAYVAFALDGDGLKQIRCRSHYVTGRPVKPVPLYKGVTRFRKLVELGLQFVPAMAKLFWNIAYRFVLKQSMHCVSELRGYTFFMAPNVWAHRWLARRGRAMKVLEQTYVVPAGALQGFLDTLVAGCHTEGLDPALCDVVWLPADDDFLLSSSRSGGFAVNIAFTGLERAGRAEQVKRLFARWTEDCATMGGQVHLTKNVIGDPATLRAMYGSRLEAFLALKARVDPRGLLGSDFLDRVFGLSRASDAPAGGGAMPGKGTGMAQARLGARLHHRGLSGRR